MTEALLILFVLIMIIVPCVAVVVLGQWIKRRASRKTPESPFVRKLTPTGIVLYTVYASLFLVVIAASRLVPESKLGALLGQPGWTVMALFALWALFTITDVVATRLGRPLQQKVKHKKPES